MVKPTTKLCQRSSPCQRMPKEQPSIPAAKGNVTPKSLVTNDKIIVSMVAILQQFDN